MGGAARPSPQESPADSQPLITGACVKQEQRRQQSPGTVGYDTFDHAGGE